MVSGTPSGRILEVEGPMNAIFHVTSNLNWLGPNQSGILHTRPANSSIPTSTPLDQPTTHRDTEISIESTTTFNPTDNHCNLPPTYIGSVSPAVSPAPLQPSLAWVTLEGQAPARLAAVQAIGTPSPIPKRPHRSKDNLVRVAFYCRLLRRLRPCSQPNCGIPQTRALKAHLDRVSFTTRPDS